MSEHNKIAGRPLPLYSERLPLLGHFYSTAFRMPVEIPAESAPARVQADEFNALEVVSKLEPSRGPSHTHWWQHTGFQLALMLKEAGYPVEKQLETLLFYYHWIVRCALLAVRQC